MQTCRKFLTTMNTRPALTSFALFKAPTLLTFTLALWLASCGSTSKRAEPTGTGSPAATSPASPATGAAKASDSGPSAASAAAKDDSATANAAGSEGQPCGALNCRRFQTPEAAFSSVLARDVRVLGIGETHALRGTEHLKSTTRRFTEALLPQLKGRASDIIVELLAPNSACQQRTERVREEQKEVTEKQASTNQNEFVVLGHRARQLGIVPDILRPSCDDLAQISAAGSNDIAVMLEMIRRLTEDKVKSLLVESKNRPGPPLVVAYGGALHNDLAPRPGHESWSYGPALSEFVSGKYVELDLIVREFIKDTESWRALEWYPHFDRTKYPDQTILFNPRPNVYVLIFPKSPG